MACRSGVLLTLTCFWMGLGRFGGPALPSSVYSCVGRHHMHHSSSCLQAEQSIMSSSDNKFSSSSEQKISSKEQQTLLSESEYVGVVRHPLSTYYVHKDILNIPVSKTPDFEAAPSRVHSLTTLAYLAWVGWPKPSSSSEQLTSSKEQKTSESEYIGVVRHPLSTYYIHKDILNMPVSKSPDFEATSSRVHSLTTLAYLAWVGWPRPKDPGSDNPNQTTCSCGCTTNGRPHIRVRQN